MFLGILLLKGHPNFYQKLVSFLDIFEKIYLNINTFIFEYMS